MRVEQPTIDDDQVEDDKLAKARRSQIILVLIGDTGCGRDQKQV